MRYPFLFEPMTRMQADSVGEAGEGFKQGQAAGKFVVKISDSDGKVYNSTWMDDPILGTVCVIPDVDMTYETHVFDTEIEARKFIQKWWAEQKL